MYDLRPTKEGDINQLHIRAWDHWGMALQPVFDARLNEFAYAFTMLHTGAPYAIVYGYFTGPGVCDVFVTADADIKRHALHFLASCEYLLQLGFEEEVRRWQIIVPPHLHVSCRLAERLGFQIEGLLTDYYPDSDGILYARVRAKE